MFFGLGLELDFAVTFKNVYMLSACNVESSPQSHAFAKERTCAKRRCRSFCVFRGCL
jgi:hypothetical protein